MGAMYYDMQCICGDLECIKSTLLFIQVMSTFNCVF